MVIRFPDPLTPAFSADFFSQPVLKGFGNYADTAESEPGTPEIRLLEHLDALYVDITIGLF